MRFLDLEHDTLSAPDDAGLTKAVRRYLTENDEEMTDDEIAELIEGEAYEALDS
ncbi:MAG: hypothetical protein H0V26_00610 [Solirubrobacterales bacterium]|nr:hypothetical protein [Solirubrobacterales bacterium]